MPGIRTFKDLHRGDGDSDSEDEKNLFTGGERSGLEVEKPPKEDARDLVQELLDEAAATARRPDTRESDPTPARFRGLGYRLGTEEGPSEVIPGRPVRDMRKLKKTCYFWKDGFLIDDGPLYRYDDPQNRIYIEQMKQGNAPMHLFGVQPGQNIDISIVTNLTQNYRPPKNKNPFSGTGHRLGAPVEASGVVISDKGKEKIEVSPEANPEPEEPEDDSKTVVQVRLADGRRLKVSVKKDGPVSQVYDFVDTVFQGEGERRAYFLSLSYPVKELAKDISIEDAKLIRAVVVQRWR